MVLGPRTTMGICSEAAISWITAKLGTRRFRVVARQFMQDIVYRLKTPGRLLSQRSPEPSPELARHYAAGKLWKLSYLCGHTYIRCQHSSLVHKLQCSRWSPVHGLMPD